jgi:hypothetical protein
MDSERPQNATGHNIDFGLRERFNYNKVLEVHLLIRYMLPGYSLQKGPQKLAD